MTLTWIAAAAFAQDALTMSAVRHAQVGFGQTSVTFHPNVSGSIDASLTCSGRRYHLATSISPGSPQTVPLDGLPQGSHTCTGSLRLTASDGSTGEMPLSLSVQILPALKLAVAREDLDLGARTLVVQGDRPLSRVTVEVLGPGGARVGQGEIGGGLSTRVDMQWSQPSGEAIKLVVVGYDEHDLPGRLELSPWSYAIPHEDVVFETAKWDIRPKEEPKLEKAWKDLQDVLAKYGEVVEVQLFVAGYTDTVGAPSGNQTLSQNRARSIAAWFRRRGFAGSIWFQGFGESALAVSTGDEVDEERNRRALYVLAAETPPISGELPSSNWSRLP